MTFLLSTLVLFLLFKTTRQERSKRRAIKALALQVDAFIVLALKGDKDPQRVARDFMANIDLMATTENYRDTLNLLCQMCEMRAEFEPNSDLEPQLREELIHRLGVEFARTQSVS
jgi:GAF domain-containing protein